LFVCFSFSVLLVLPDHQPATGLTVKGSISVAVGEHQWLQSLVSTEEAVHSAWKPRPATRDVVMEHSMSHWKAQLRDGIAGVTGWTVFKGKGHINANHPKTGYGLSKFEILKIIVGRPK
jgi:hypothetical protein